MSCYLNFLLLKQGSSEMQLPADSQRSTWQAWCRRWLLWLGMWMQSWDSHTHFGNPPCCETTGSNITAEHPQLSDDLDLHPPIAVTPAEQQEDPKGLLKQITNPQFLWRFTKVSPVACLPVCFLFCRSQGARCSVCVRQEKYRVGTFHRNVGLDNKPVTGLPAPDVLQVWQTPETVELCVCVLMVTCFKAFSEHSYPDWFGLS